MSIKALDGIDERYIKIGKEIQELANEMEKDGLITRDDKYDEYGEDRLFQLLAKKILITKFFYVKTTFTFITIPFLF